MSTSNIHYRSTERSVIATLEEVIPWSSIFFEKGLPMIVLREEHSLDNIECQMNSRRFRMWVNVCAMNDSRKERPLTLDYGLRCVDFFGTLHVDEQHRFFMYGGMRVHFHYTFKPLTWVESLSPQLFVRYGQQPRRRIMHTTRKFLT